ncbi:MAG TPA: hypothetical protein VFW87_20210 [Pirellulales bacterium]|nr:hypothetical protein [Pirellulales bacterium]
MSDATGVNLPSPEERAATASVGRSAPSAGSESGAPERIVLISYPKVIFLYPMLLAAVAAALYMSFTRRPLDSDNPTATTIATIFLGIVAVNFVVLAFDFPRTTSLTLFFFAAAVVMGLILLFEYEPQALPAITETFGRFRPLANATFYWTVAAILGVIFAVSYVVVHFDYWEVRPNELLHHHGVLSNLERFSAPHLRIDKEINDVFEYLLLRSGRLILQPSSERRAIILDNVPFIERKEQALTRMLGALQVQVRAERAEE